MVDFLRSASSVAQENEYLPSQQEERVYYSKISNQPVLSKTNNYKESNDKSSEKYYGSKQHETDSLNESLVYAGIKTNEESKLHAFWNFINTKTNYNKTSITEKTEPQFSRSTTERIVPSVPRDIIRPQDQYRDDGRRQQSDQSFRGDQPRGPLTQRTYFPYRGIEKTSSFKPYQSTTSKTSTTRTPHPPLSEEHPVHQWNQNYKQSEYPLFRLNSVVLSSLELPERDEDGEFYIDKELRILYDPPSNLKVAQGTTKNLLKGSELVEVANTVTA